MLCTSALHLLQCLSNPDTHDMVTYAGKLVLAPMVRAGELPTRLMALRHGADLVWSPELVDVKLMHTQRIENKALSTVDYIETSTKQGHSQGNNVVFRTLPSEESGKLILQLGSNNPENAVRAALNVVRDVAGIDLNCGCPKHFSVHNGMGAALLSTPDLLCSILTKLVESVGRVHDKPVSCKIRVLDTLEDTLQLVERLCGTGIAHLTVHCRTRDMRNREAPRWEYLAPIAEACKRHGVSVTLNGAVKSRAHFKEVQQELGLGPEVGAMIAEHAERNPSVFREGEPLQWPAAAREYLALAQSLDNHVGNTKYMLGRIIPGKQKMYQCMTRCKTDEELSWLVEQMDDEGKCTDSDPLKHILEMREGCGKRKVEGAKDEAVKRRKVESA